MNCTFVGNGTEKSTSCGGGIGKNGGKLYAVNCILVDNYAQIGSTVARNDFAIYSGSSNIGLFNCLYGSSGSAGTNCITDTSNETFNSYVTEGIIRSNGSLSTSFTHPELFEGDNEYDLYLALDKNSPALTGGIATYFDYSDTSNIKMGLII